MTLKGWIVDSRTLTVTSQMLMNELFVGGKNM
jgi:hypothetical protein